MNISYNGYVIYCFHLFKDLQQRGESDRLFAGRVYVTVEFMHEMEYNILNQAAKLYHKKRRIRDLHLQYTYF